MSLIMPYHDLLSNCKMSNLHSEHNTLFFSNGIIYETDCNLHT